MNACATLLKERPVAGTVLVFTLAVLAYASVSVAAGAEFSIVATGLFAVVFTVLYVGTMRYWEWRSEGVTTRDS